MDTTSPAPRVLVIGLDPYRVPGPWDPKPVADAIEVGIARFAEQGVGVQTCLFGLDGSDDVEAVVAAALRARPWECVVIGGGVRHEDQLELFEQVVNLVRRCAPDAAIAFGSTPAGTFDAAARWIDIPGPASGQLRPSKRDERYSPGMSEATTLYEWAGGREAIGPGYTERLGGYPAMVAHHRDLGITADQRFRFASLMSLAADDADLPADPEFRAALVGYLEWGTRLAMHNSQPGADVVQQAPVPRWGWGVAPPYRP